MKSPLESKSIVLGVTGSIACYKAADLVSKLVQAGSLLDVILTREATQLVTPLTFRSITHRPVVTEMFDPDSELSVEHVALAERADIVVVAPATAHTIARMAHGLVDDMLTATLLATAAPVVVAPAMDAHMYDHAATQENLATLRSRGVTIVGPGQGHLASGLWGTGRLVEPAEIMGHIAAVLGCKGDLAGRTIVVSAGGTAESIDPARIITNRSTGKQGYAIAEAARDRGARVKLVAASTVLPDPPAIEIARVETVAQMRQAVLRACEDADALIMAAAVGDFRPAESAVQKIKKTEDGNGLVLQLVETPDFLLEVPDSVVKVGFAAESQDLLENARHKLVNKRLALIAANDITATDSGFAVDTNKVTILDREGGAEELPLTSKYEVGHRILDRVVKLLNTRD